MAQEVSNGNIQEGKEKHTSMENSPNIHLQKEELNAEDEFPEEIEENAEEPNVPISELRKVRSEAARYRKQLRQLESRLEKEQKAAEFAKMEETERLKAIASEAEARAKAFKRRAEAVAKRAAIINAASVMGFHNPEDAASIVDIEQLEVDDEGNVDREKVNQIVNSIVESKPYLVKRQHESQDIADYGPTNPASDSWPKPKLRTKDQIDRLKQQSNEALRSGKVASAVKLYNQAWEIERGIKKPKGG